MTNPTPKIFRCAICGGIFDFDPDCNEEARQEAEKQGFDIAECDMVCEDCYNKTPFGDNDEQN